VEFNFEIRFQCSLVKDRKLVIFSNPLVVNIMNYY